MEQPQDDARRGADHPAAGVAGRDPDDDYSQRLYNACFAPSEPSGDAAATEDEDGVECTGARGCPACPEPEDYDGYIDWLRAH